MAKQETRARCCVRQLILWMLIALGALGLQRAVQAEGAPTTTAASQPGGGVAASKLVTNLWVETDLRQVIQDIAAQTDTIIVCDQTVQGVVSMAVKDMPLEDCLERVCTVGGYSFTAVKDYYVVGKSEPGFPLFQRMSDPQRLKLSYVSAEQMKCMLHSSLAPYVTFDKATGTVIVTAPEPLRQRVLEAIKLLDQPSRQVAIEAVVFELTETGSKQLGLDWKFKASHFAARSDNLIGTITYGEASDLGIFVEMTLRAIVESGRGQVLANPRVLVMNNTEAEIFVGQEKYFSLLSGQASNPYYTLQSIKAGVTLKVLPYIGEDGQVTLNLEPEVSDVVADNARVAGNDLQGGVGTPLPVVTRRHAKTVVNVRDGQTVLIGGLLMEQQRSIIDKVPLAGDIPAVGAAFRNVQSQKQQQEVVILITAHLLDGRRTGSDNLPARLKQRYVTPLDAIAAAPQGLAKCN